MATFADEADETESIDHDRLFKELLTAHFEQFLAGFFPEIHSELDFSGFGPDAFLPQEQFPEMGGRLHRLDVVARVKRKGSQDAVVIVFIEAQRTRNQAFLARVFRYFALLHLKYEVTVVPVVLFSDAEGWEGPEKWSRYAVAFAGHTILDFRFFVLKPSTLRLRDYLRSSNAAQLALAALMKLDSAQLIRSKLELLKQLNTLKLTEAELLKLANFVDTYLSEGDDELQGEAAQAKAPEDPRMGKLLDYLSEQYKAEWREVGIAEGRAEGLAAGIAEGKAEGLAEGRQALVQAAARLLGQGLPRELVMEATGLQEQELPEVQRST